MGNEMSRSFTDTSAKGAELIDVDLLELANIMLDNLPFNITTDDVLLHDNESWDDFIHDYLAEITPVGMIITEPSLEHLEEELWIMIKREMFNRLHLQVTSFDKEEKEILKSKTREFVIELDGG